MGWPTWYYFRLRITSEPSSCLLNLHEAKAFCSSSISCRLYRFIRRVLCLHRSHKISDMSKKELGRDYFRIHSVIRQLISWKGFQNLSQHIHVPAFIHFPLSNLLFAFHISRLSIHAEKSIQESFKTRTLILLIIIYFEFSWIIN